MLLFIIYLYIAAIAAYKLNTFRLNEIQIHPNLINKKTLMIQPTPILNYRISSLIKIFTKSRFVYHINDYLDKEFYIDIKNQTQLDLSKYITLTPIISLFPCYHKKYDYNKPYLQALDDYNKEVIRENVKYFRKLKLNLLDDILVFIVNSRLFEFIKLTVIYKLLIISIFCHIISLPFAIFNKTKENYIINTLFNNINYILNCNLIYLNIFNHDNKFIKIHFELE
jgi:hypothetical protein